MIGIVCAMSNEAQAVLDNMDIYSTFNTFGKKCYTGSLNNQKCALIISGVGKVNSAIATQYLLDTYKEIKTILNIGVSGGVRGKVEAGQIYIVSQASQYDFDTSEVDNSPVGYFNEIGSQYIDLVTPISAELSRIYPYARLVTGDRFTCKQEIVDFIEEHFGAELRDMEGGAIAQVCYFHKVNCVMLKGVSDYVGPNSSQMFIENCQKVIDNMTKQIPLIINAIATK